MKTLAECELEDNETTQRQKQEKEERLSAPITRGEFIEALEQCCNDYNCHRTHDNDLFYVAFKYLIDKLK